MNWLFKPREEGFKSLSIGDYRAQFVTGLKQHVLIDVRSSGEFRDGHLPNAINIPLDQLQRRLSEVPQGKPVVVVCASGNRSRSGSQILAQVGYGEVYNLVGGTMGWMMQGNPVVK